MAKKKEIVEEQKIDYSPLTEQEWNDSLMILEETKTGKLNPNLANTTWALHVKIRGVKERQPCNCASSGRHWLRAVNTIREFVDNVRGK
jgi:hypothetical protein